MVIKGIAGSAEIQSFVVPEKAFEYIVVNYSTTGVEVPSVLFLDINMPTWSGWDFLENFDKLDERIKKQITIYMLSSSINAKDRERALETRIAVDYIAKPLNSKTVSTIFLSEQSDFNEVASKHVNEYVPESAHESELVKALEAPLEKISFKKKQPLFRQGDICRSLYYVLSGKIKTFKANGNGKVLITGLHKPGEFLGYLPLLENSVHNETAVGFDEGEVAAIPKDVFRKLVFENQKVNREFLGLIAKDLLEKDDRLLALAYDSVRQRVAGALLQVQRKYDEGSSEKFSISFTRDDLANIVGTATESLIRTLSDFKDEGTIEINASTISITDKGKLEKVRG